MSNIKSVSNKAQPQVTKMDMSMKVALLIGGVLIVFLFWFYPNLIRLSLYTGCVVCLGLFLPRQAGWNIRERRAKKSKLAEQQKWGFASRDREGPWINYIDYPLVRNTPLADSKFFYSDWLVIENGKVIVNPGSSEVDLESKTVNYDLAKPNTYAWDGCTPKRLFFWLALLGTPDWWHGEHTIQVLSEQGQLVEKKVFWQLCMHASLVHDALYQYLDSIPITKMQVDQLFHDMLLEAGMPKYLAKVYHWSVDKFGANDVYPDDPQPNSDFKCDDFKQL
ncbi:DUF1353 domain-containing protein [uncultured Paraglaciecola sp.]|uniref:DUF1353 domain-containing protein n=1 Tax=uncultured Paraglaciecola sp. TaxID=1765024 RepID=UPI0030DB2E4C|tara:strand:- start:65861 stop:66694 length:834 start_codon:yes stop_codon:yes gene_type:complete